MIEVETRIGRRFTIVIPKRIRDALGLREGQRLRLHVERGRIIVEPLPADPLTAYSEIVRDLTNLSDLGELVEGWVMGNARG